MMLSHAREWAVLLTVCGVLLAGETAAVTGHEWKNLSSAMQKAYVLGVVDTWYDLESFHPYSKQTAKSKELPEKSAVPPSIVTHLIKCISGKMTYDQIIAIVGKYMENHPAQWHHAMPALTWNAVAEACLALMNTEK